MPVTVLFVAESNAAELATVVRARILARAAPSARRQMRTNPTLHNQARVPTSRELPHPKPCADAMNYVVDRFFLSLLFTVGPQLGPGWLRREHGGKVATTGEQRLGDRRGAATGE